jgi:hypothetical protein
MSADKVIIKLRDQADRLQPQIDDKLRDRETNTHKKLKHAMQARNEGQHLRRIQAALRALADAREAGTLPPILADLKTKAAVHPLLVKKLDPVSNGYHGYHVETPYYLCTDEQAQTLHKLIDGTKSTADKAADAELERKLKIEKLENALRFAGIAGFFPTPRPIIEQMLDLAWTPERDRMTVLEPSAGKGDMLEAIRDHWPHAKARGVEANRALYDILALKGFDVVNADFMEWVTAERFDRIIMNPPFERGQDIDHVMKAATLLKPGGRLVAIVSAGSLSRSDRKAKEFQNWLAITDAVQEKLPADAFKSGFVATGVSTAMILVQQEQLPRAIAVEPTVPARRSRKSDRHQLELAFS